MRPPKLKEVSIPVADSEISKVAEPINSEEQIASLTEELSKERKHRADIEASIKTKNVGKMSLVEAKIKNWPKYTYWAKDITGRDAVQITVDIDYGLPVYWVYGDTLDVSTREYHPINGLVPTLSVNGLRHFIYFDNGYAVTNNRGEADYLLHSGIVSQHHQLIADSPVF